MVNLIVAYSQNRVIGINNKLPWNIPPDLKRFKQLTSGNVVVMGRKTYESIGRPLPNRKNIILTSNTNYIAPGCIVFNSHLDILEKMGDIWVIGGEQIYKLFLPYVDKIEATIVDKYFRGDSYFPKFENDFKLEKSLIMNYEDLEYKYSTFIRNGK